MKSVFAHLALIIGLWIIPASDAVDARDRMQIAGSSTVLPYAQIVARAFGSVTFFPTPNVESGGSSIGLQELCPGEGIATVDVANSSRRIRNVELDACRAIGVEEIYEVKFGYDGIVFAYDIYAPAMAFKPEDWYLALAAQVVQNGHLVDNPYTTWNEVNSRFPAKKITAYIPGKNHGTREVFAEKVLATGCKAVGALEFMLASGMTQNDAQLACRKVRVDGSAVEVDGDYTETLHYIRIDRAGIGVFGLAFYYLHADKLQVASVNGVFPSTKSIANGNYPISRPLFFYLNQAKIGKIPGLSEYVNFFLSEEISGPVGPLADIGLVALPNFERQQQISQFQRIGDEY